MLYVAHNSCSQYVEYNWKCGTHVRMQSAIHSDEALICFALLVESLKIYIILKAMYYYHIRMPTILS